MKTPCSAAAATDCNEPALLFADLGPRKVAADFSGGTISSDGGVLLLRQVDEGLGVTAALAQPAYGEKSPFFFRLPQKP